MGLIVVARDGTEDNGEDDDEDDEIMGTAGSTGRLLEVLADEIGEVGSFAGLGWVGVGIVEGTVGGTGVVGLIEIIDDDNDDDASWGVNGFAEIDGGGIIRPNEVDLDADDGPEDASGATVGWRGRVIGGTVVTETNIKILDFFCFKNRTYHW